MVTILRPREATWSIMRCGVGNVGEKELENVFKLLEIIVQILNYLLEWKGGD